MDSEEIKFWKKEGWLRGLIKLFLTLLLLFILLGFASYLSKVHAWYFIGIDVYYITAMIISVCFISFSFTYRKFMFKEYFKRMRISGVSLKMTILSMIITVFALYAILSSFQLRNINLVDSLGMKLSLSKMFFSTFIYFLTQVFFVAFGEEILFRGYAQNILEAFFSEKMKRFYWIFSIGISSLLFTVFHLFSTNELTFSLRFFNVFLGSCVIGFTYYKSRNIWNSIFIHGGYNTLEQIIQNFIVNKINFISKILNEDLINSGVPKDISQGIVNKVAEIMSR